MSVPPTKPTGRDPSCLQCTQPEPLQGPYVFPSSQKAYRPGDIVAIHESVHVPIDNIFKSSAIHIDGADSLVAAALPSLANSSKGKVRPGIVLEPRPKAAPTEAETILSAVACIMATYGGIHTFDGLPTILQHFCTPISPHGEIQENVNHLHTSPEWQKDHSWFIAVRFPSRGKVSGRWEWKSDVDGQSTDSELSFKLDKKQLGLVINTCADKWDEWVVRCREDPELVNKSKRDYEAFRQKRPSTNPSKVTLARSSTPSVNRAKSPTASKVELPTSSPKEDPLSAQAADLPTLAYADATGQDTISDPKAITVQSGARGPAPTTRLVDSSVAKLPNVASDGTKNTETAPKKGKKKGKRRWPKWPKRGDPGHGDSDGAVATS